MLGNIIDSRENRYDAVVNAVFEPSCHDNSIENATKFPETEVPINEVAECKYSITVREAIQLAEKKSYYVTVFLYDADIDPLEARFKSTVINRR